MLKEKKPKPWAKFSADKSPYCTFSFIIDIFIFSCVFQTTLPTQDCVQGFYGQCDLANMSSFLLCGSSMLLVLFQSSLCFLLCYCLCLGGAPSEDMQSCFLLFHGGCPELGTSHTHEQHTTSGFPVQILVPSMAIRTVHCFCGSCSSTLLHVHVLVLVSRE